MNHTECKDCKFREGDCGHHHRIDGEVNCDIPSLSSCDKYGNCGYFQQKETPKGDLISRSALQKKLQENHDFFVNAWGGFKNLPPNDKARVDEITNCISEVVNAPTINPSFNLDNITEEEIEKFKIIWQRANSKGLLAINEERPQGEWITVHYAREELNCPEKSMLDFVKCPFCETIHQGRHNFCSRCGADMRGGKEQ